MRLLINANVFGWRMTGLLPKGARWFFGFATRTTESEHKIDVLQRQVAQLLAERDKLKDGYWDDVGTLRECGCEAEEIDRLRQLVGGTDDLSQQLIDRLEMLEVQAVREIAPGWIGIPTVEWDSIMGPNAQAQGLAAPDTD